MDLTAAVDTLTDAQRNGTATGFDVHVARLRSLLGGELEQVEAEMPRVLDGSVSPLPETGQHLLAAGGKRVRPIMTLLAAAAVGRSGADARKLACAGELVHLSTLLHDDVIDDADRRRGQPTPRVVWSNTVSVLGGDYALTRALDLVASVPSPHPLREAVATLRLLVEGEILQLRHRGGAAIDRDVYYAIIDRKTASLFEWCCRAGAHLGDRPEVAHALGVYGHEVGRCFQVVDDVLDFVAATDVGKDAFADLREGKFTLPVLVAIEREPTLRDELAHLNEDAAAKVLSRALDQTGALAEARQIALKHARAASSALVGVPDGPQRAAFAQIADALAGRVA